MFLIGKAIAIPSIYYLQIAQIMNKLSDFKLRNHAGLMPQRLPTSMHWSCSQLKHRLLNHEQERLGCRGDYLTKV
jgi:hypothetical protein